MTSSNRLGGGAGAGNNDVSHPLRPYYDSDTFNAGYSVTFKQGVGLIDSDTNKALTPSLSSSIIEQSVNENTGILKKVGGSGGGYNPGVGIHANRRFGNRSSILNGGNNGDKNYIYDLEFQEYFDLNNLSELFKNLLWNFLKNYCKVLLSQPLEIVRLVLQIGQFDFPDSTKKIKKSDPITEKRLLTESDTLTLTENEDLSDYEINYFQSPSDNLYNSTTSPKKFNSSPKKKRANNSTKRKRSNKIQPLSMHSIDIMSAIVGKDGPFALFKGINASFIHQTLSHTIEAWITGFISPFLGIPDPFFLDLTHSNDPLRSLWLSVSACVLTGLILMPLDIIKIRLMITQFNKPLLEDNNTKEKLLLEKDNNNNTGFTSSESSVHNLANSTLNVNANLNNQYVSTRSVRESIRNFPVQYLVNPPSSIVLLTILYQFSTSIFRKTAPYILLIRFNIDSYSSPNVYTIINLISLIMEFFIKLPVENLLRKEQIRFLLKPKSLSEDPYRVLTIDNPDENLIIEFNSTWADVIDEEYEEGDNEEQKEKERLSYWGTLKSLGLFNGWRVGVLNVIGFWGYNIFKNNGTELREERF
ncbi:hypothetical protein DFJ63DRAFT_313023 [Scheffersomyces coipomensis]|uniref:uncharacterized protein n=1 Tax=Scheffersomyces coipomensis TaxID=1788519 RepID=UPI00315D6403